MKLWDPEEKLNIIEIPNYATEDVSWLRLRNNDVISLKVKLKGGMDRQFDMNIETEG